MPLTNGNLKISIKYSTLSLNLSPKLTLTPGSEINFFWRHQLATKIFFSRQMEKCSRQKVSVKLFLCSETQAKIIGRHGLAGKISAINVIRNQTSSEIIF